MGFNSSMGNCPSTVLVLDQHGNAAVGLVIKRLPAESAPWKQKENGKPWAYVYKVKWLKVVEGYVNKALTNDIFTPNAAKEAAVEDILNGLHDAP